MGFELMGAIFGDSWPSFIFSLSKALAGLGFVIFVHELGHFLVAKACGVKCEKFYIGFDIPMPWGIPSRFCRFQWGETEYGIGVLPLGGYVKMLGQDDNPMNAEEEAERTRIRSENSEGSDAESASAPAEDKPFEIDPRSYPAKTVPQRMAIISAGVIMNIIFAVIFAAVAFRIGVPYTPCEVGEVIPGGPAWKAGFPTNTRIVQFGDQGEKNEKLRFDFDLRQAVAINGSEQEMSLLVQAPDGNSKWVKLRPVSYNIGWDKPSSIGIAAARTTKVGMVVKGSAADVANGLMDGDVVIAVNGEPVSSHLEIQRKLAANPGEPITITAERTTVASAEAATQKQQIDVTIPVAHRKDIGLVMKQVGVAGVEPASPAAIAGIREGDVIESIGGVAFDDPVRLPFVVRPFIGKETELVVRRAGSEDPIRLKLTPRQPTGFDSVPLEAIYVGTLIPSDALGLVVQVDNTVHAVVSGSPAARAGLAAGDILRSVDFVSDDPNKPRATLSTRGKAQPLDDQTIGWPFVDRLLQYLPADEQLKLEYERGNTLAEAIIRPEVSPDLLADRGLLFHSVSEKRIASTWGEAIRLGARQTWEDGGRVLGMLHKLITGKVAVTNLGGIGSIVAVAGNEASQGFSRLLIFLTMLSANLAVLNFLPIPALDGGHMMFLMYEGIFRRPVSERVQIALTIGGVVCLLGLMLLVNAFDVKRLFF